MKNILLLILVLVIGCGQTGAGKPTLNPAKGKVSLANGTLLSTGTISFEPSGGRAFRCSGPIGPDGTFELETGSDKDKGASAGKYKVAVSFALVNKRPPAIMKSIPKKYLDTDTSDLEVEIVSGNNDLDIKLK